MSTAESQGSCLGLARISAAVLTQQHAVNMCLNAVRAKRSGCCRFPSETAAVLKLKCFTV